MLVCGEDRPVRLPTGGDRNSVVHAPFGGRRRGCYRALFDARHSTPRPRWLFCATCGLPVYCLLPQPWLAVSHADGCGFIPSPIDRFTKGRITAPQPDVRLKLICTAQHQYSNTLTMIRSSGNWGIKYLDE